MPTPTFDLQTILQTLCKHNVEFIIVGGVCAVLHGAPLATLDLDVVHARTAENLDRLLAALRDLDAYYRQPSNLRLVPGLTHLASPGHQLLMTKSGPLDLLGTVGADLGYDELLPHTVGIQIAFDVSTRLLNLTTLIELKTAAGREKDRAVLPILLRTLEEKAKL